jgi:hypothetical protein
MEDQVPEVVNDIDNVLTVNVDAGDLSLVVMDDLDEFNDADIVTIEYQPSKVDDMQEFISELKNATNGNAIFETISKLSRKTSQLGCGCTFNRCITGLKNMGKLPADFPVFSKLK